MSLVQGEQPGISRSAAPWSELDLLDRNPDPSLDELTALAAVLCRADFAYIAWLDQSRLWFKSRHGFFAVEQPRALSPCHLTAESASPFLIYDALQDARFPASGIDLAGAARCRSYAAVPLFSADAGPGQRVVGTLAVLAEAPACFGPEHVHLLEILARQVCTRLDLYDRIDALEQEYRARMRTERALAIERSFVAATLDSIPALVAVLDTAGRVVRLNHACAQLTGLAPEEAAGRPFADQVLEDVDCGWIADKLHEAVEGEISGPHESGWRTLGNSTRRIRWTLRPLASLENEIQYLVVTGQDVTDQREVEKALLSSETRYRQVVENSLGFLFTCSLEGRMTSLNAFTAETLGYRIEDLTGHSFTEFLDAGSAASFEVGLRNLAAGAEWRALLRIRRSDGGYRHIAFRSRMMELPDRQRFVLNHGMDMTEQHEAEEALRTATRQRELILESVGDGICGIDLEGRLTFINEAAAKILDFPAAQLRGQPVLEIVRHGRENGAPYTTEANPILKAMRRREQIRMRDEVFWRSDGVAIPVEYSASPLVEDGRVSGMVVAFQDVSERRRLERMKDEFISTVSHELRTPLTSLRASLGLLSSGSLDEKPDKQKQMVSIAIGNCDRLVRLVNGILDFEKLEKGRITLNLRPLNAADLVRRAAETAQPAAEQAHIELVIEAEPAKVLADEQRALQVLGELISNAIKFSPSETKIRLACREVAGREVCFEVEDRGRGIAPEKIGKIFDRFQQGDASDSRDLGGTGLGLALCRGIVEQHGGRIWAECEPGHGAKFLFTLPAPKENS